MIKNRTIIAIVCIFLALLLSFGVVPLLNKASSSKVEIVRLTADIKTGAMITDNIIEIVKVGEYNLPDSVIKDKSEVVGKYATADLFTGDYITPSKITVNIDTTESILNSLDNDEMAISINVDFNTSLSGKLEVGDIVSLITKKDDELADIPTELTYVEVIAVTAGDGKDTNNNTEKSDSESGLPKTVTFRANAEQATLIALNDGNIHIALVHRGDKEVAQQYLNLQKTHLQGVDSDTENNDDEQTRSDEDE